MDVSTYEKAQTFNRIVSWLHEQRYRQIDAILRPLVSGKPLRIVDIGCAHAKLYAHLNERMPIDYIGIEIDPEMVEIARARYGDRKNFTLYHESALTGLDRLEQIDAVVAFESFEHIYSGEALRIIEKIAAHRPKVFVASVPVEIGPAVWIKNVGSWLCGYERWREYTWAETFWAGLYRFGHLPKHRRSHKSFDWRWLAQTMRQHMHVQEVRRLPFGLAPTGLSMSVMMIAQPWPD